MIRERVSPWFASIDHLSPWPCFFPGGFSRDNNIIFATTSSSRSKYSHIRSLCTTGLAGGWGRAGGGGGGLVGLGCAAVLLGRVHVASMGSSGGTMQVSLTLGE